jgi:hypothetical protein
MKRLGIFPMNLARKSGLLSPTLSSTRGGEGEVGASRSFSFTKVIVVKMRPLAGAARRAVRGRLGVRTEWDASLADAVASLPREKFKQKVTKETKKNLVNNAQLLATALESMQNSFSG